MRKVFPDSILLANEGEVDPKGAILVSISYSDPFLSNGETLNPTAYTRGSDNPLISSSGVEVTAQFDYHGSVNLFKRDGTLITDRKLDLSEMVDLLPISCVLTLQLYTSGVDCPVAKVAVNYQPREIYRLRRAQPFLQPFDFEILAGLCIMPLMVDHRRFNNELECYYAKGRNRYRPRLLICQVFPGTEASRVKSINQGDLLLKFNNTKVTTLDELRQVLVESSASKYLSFLTRNGAPLVVARATALTEDTQVMDIFKIRDGHHHLSSG